VWFMLSRLHPTPSRTSRMLQKGMAILIASLNWEGGYVMITSKILFFWSRCSQGVPFPNVYTWAYKWCWYCNVLATKRRPWKCVDDVWSCETCSRLNYHGLSCLWLGILQSIDYRYMRQVVWRCWFTNPHVVFPYKTC